MKLNSSFKCTPVSLQWFPLAVNNPPGNADIFALQQLPVQVLCYFVPPHHCNSPSRENLWSYFFVVALPLHFVQATNCLCALQTYMNGQYDVHLQAQIISETVLKDVRVLVASDTREIDLFLVSC